MDLFNIILLIFAALMILLILALYLKSHKVYNTKHLVFSSVGDRNNVRTWTSDPSKKNFDLVIYYFGEEENPVFDADLVVKRKGLKFDNFHHFLNHNDISQYESIWVVDDDIIMDTASINKMFFLFSKYKLWLAQPSFSEGSRISWGITRKNPDCILRFTNFVECGAPIFSREILPQLIKTFKDARTGFGVDLIWPTLLGFPKNKIAIIDTVTCHHPKNVHSSIDEVVPRQLHLTQGVELLNDYGLLSTDCNPLQCNTWDLLYDQLPHEVREFREYTKIKKQPILLNLRPCYKMTAYHATFDIFSSKLIFTYLSQSSITLSKRCKHPRFSYTLN